MAATLLRRTDWVHFWQLARPLNLLIAGLTFGLAAWLSALGSFRFVDDYRFWLELGAILGAMAGGYWINDVYDFRIDQINRPDSTLVGLAISRKKVLTGYFVSLGIVTLLTALLPWKFWIVNLSAIGALYWYAAVFKRYAVVGNVLIAALTALVVLAGALLYHLKFPLFWGMVFAFQSTLLREVVKDVEDLRGDLRHGLQTLPIAIGLSPTRRVLRVGYVIFFISLWLPVAFHYAYEGVWLLNYLAAVLVLVQLPTAYCVFLLHTSYKPVQYRFQSRVLKGIMAGGLVSLLFLPL
jgi:4-hydroxybenzoate polyprenyltransferase